ncbi:MAG: GHKL domain-containing protein [Lachnospiraceae bacterium]|nr:GHKL domain-containing protein [Lachnospiraceae bacterium]
MPPLNNIISFFNGTLEFITVMLLMETLSVHRKNRIVKCVVFVLVISCLFLMNFLSVGSLIIIICYTVYIFYALWLNHFNIKQALENALFSFGCASAVEMALYIVNNLVIGKLVMYQWVTFISVLELFIVYLVFKKTAFMSKIKDLLNNKENGIYLLSTIGCAMFIVVFANYKITSEMQIYESIYLVLGIIVLFVSLNKIFIYQHELKIRNNYSEVYKELILQIRERQHKFINQINAIYSMINIYETYDELVLKQREELGNLEQYIMPGKYLILENPLVIAHIYQKICEAYDKNITIETEFNCSLNGIKIPDMLLVEVIGNLLDNAIDEVIGRNMNEIIYLSIIKKDGKIYIEVANEHEQIAFNEYKNFFNNGYSSKGDDRGYGLPYVKKIAKKYDAEIQVKNEYKHEKNCFSIKLIFSEI